MNRLDTDVRMRDLESGIAQTSQPLATRAKVINAAESIILKILKNMVLRDSLSSTPAGTRLELPSYTAPVRAQLHYPVARATGRSQLKDGNALPVVAPASISSDSSVTKQKRRLPDSYQVQPSEEGDVRVGIHIVKNVLPADSFQIRTVTRVTDQSAPKLEEVRAQLAATQVYFCLF